MSHNAIIRDQFSRQAVPFSLARSMTDEAAIQLLLDVAGARPHHRSLDIACGPGLVALAFARTVAHAVGLDTTPAMLDRARVLQAARGIENVEWVHGDAARLPFTDASFDIVTCRFAFHHLEQPGDALREMVRVTRPGGYIVVCDGTASPEPAKAAAFNAFECRRDPSTVRFLTAAELRDLFVEAGLNIEQERTYRVPVDLEGLLRASFPVEGDVPRLRHTIVCSLDHDALGFQPGRVGDQIHMSYPALILSARH